MPKATKETRDKFKLPDKVVDFHDLLRKISTKDATTSCWRYDKTKAAMADEGFTVKKGRPGVSLAKFAFNLATGKERGYFPVAVATAVLCGADTEGLVASHLCHNALCVNPDHIVCEQQWINHERTRCLVESCKHHPACLADGSLAQSMPKVLIWSGGAYKDESAKAAKKRGLKK